MININNLKVYITTIYTCNSVGEPIKVTEREVWLLYNATRITEEEIGELLDNNIWEYDTRLTQITPARLEMLQDKENNDAEYEQLKIDAHQHNCNLS